MNEPMQRWEYHVEQNPAIPVERLYDLGAAGWELTSIDVQDGTTFIFRRPAQSLVERVTMEQRAHVYESLGLDPETGL
jgi:hypothetical protein